MFPQLGLQDDIGLLKDRWAQEGSDLINIQYNPGSDATVYTVSTGKRLYIQALLVMTPAAGRDSFAIKDGVAGDIKVAVSYGTVQGDTTSITFNPPIFFDSEVYNDEIGDARGDCTLTGWEEDAN